MRGYLVIKRCWQPPEQFAAQMGSTARPLEQVFGLHHLPDLAPFSRSLLSDSQGWGDRVPFAFFRP
jgi:hypothetical protein